MSRERNQSQNPGLAAETEVKFKQALAKIEVLEQQSQQQALDHAREVNGLKQQILQRDSVEDTLRQTNTNQFY